MKRRACINDRKTRKTPTTAALTRRASANERPESRCASAGRYKQGSSRARKTKRSNSNHRRRHGAEQTQSVLTGDEELPVSQASQEDDDDDPYKVEDDAASATEEEDWEEDNERLFGYDPDRVVDVWAEYQAAMEDPLFAY